MMPYRVRFFTFSAALAISGTSGTVVAAQQLIAVSAASTMAVQSAQGNSSEKRISLNLQDVSLASALEEIQRSFGIRIVYSRDVVPVSHKVTVTGTYTATNALEQVLVGTGMHLRIMGDGRVMVGRPQTPVVQSAEQGIVTGKVLHGKTRQPVGGATILVDDSVKGGTTAADGTFRTILAEGEHRVTVRAVGFVRQVRTVVVSKEAQTSLEILLEPSANVLNEVVVTGTVVATERKAIPTPITVIKGEELEHRGITRVDQLFRGEIPGLLALEDGSRAYTNALGGLSSSRVYARGSADLSGGTNPIKTYIDGVELLDPSYLGTIDPMSIERIEIVTGPQAATIYGSGAMGGVMQIFTKQGSGKTAPEMTINLKYGVLQNNFSDSYTPTHNDAILLSGGVGPAFSYSGNISYVYTGQWQPKLFNRNYGASIGATHTNGPFTVAASLSTAFGANGTFNYTGWDWNLGFLKNLEDGTYYTSGNNKLSYISQQRSTSSSQTGSLKLDWRVTPVWQHHLTIGRSQNAFALIPVAPNYAATSGVGSDSLYRTANSVGQRTTINYNTTVVSEGGRVFSSTLTLGGNGSLGDRQNITGCLATDIATTVIGCSGGTSAPGVTRTLKDRNVGGFASVQLGMLRQFYLTLGLRGEHNPTYGSAHRIDWTPTNGATYTIELGELTVKLLGSYGQATRPPVEGYRLSVTSRNTTYDITEYISRFEAPDLRPERSRGPQVGIELYYGNLGSLTVNHYQQKVTDLIQLVPVDSIAVVRLSDNAAAWLRQSQYQNTATIRQIGWEGTGTLNVGVLQLKGTYFWNDSRILAVNPRLSTSNVGQLFRGVPTHAGSVTIGYVHGGTSVSMVTNYVGKTWYTWTQDDAFAFNQFYARHGQYSDTFNGRLFNDILHPAYTKSDVAISHRLNRSLSATIHIVNLGNSYAADTGRLNPSLGRQTSFGVSLRYP